VSVAHRVAGAKPFILGDAPGKEIFPLPILRLSSRGGNRTRVQHFEVHFFFSFPPSCRGGDELFPEPLVQHSTQALFPFPFPLFLPSSPPPAQRFGGQTCSSRYPFLLFLSSPPHGWHAIFQIDEFLMLRFCYTDPLGAGSMSSLSLMRPRSLPFFLLSLLLCYREIGFFLTFFLSRSRVVVVSLRPS